MKAQVVVLFDGTGVELEALVDGLKLKFDKTSQVKGIVTRVQPIVTMPETSVKPLRREGDSLVEIQSPTEQG